MLQDLIHSLRALFKRPGFSVLAVLTVALGVAVNTSMFTIVNGVLWKPFPYSQSERLVRFNESSPSGLLNNSGPNSADWKARSNVLEDVSLYRMFPGAILRLPDRNPPVVTAYTHPNVFSILRVQPAMGRLLNDADDHLGAQPAAVITNAAWTKYFGKDPTIIGKAIRVAMNGADSLTIVGVLPEGLEYDTVEFWVPIGRLPMKPDAMRDNHWFAGLGRLNPGITLDRARKDLQAVSIALEKEHPDTNKGIRVELQSLADYYAGRIKTPLVILFWAVGFVMLIACGNVVHLVLTRTLARGREMAVRMALGASAWRLTWLLLSEGMLLAVAGGALGVLAASWVVPAALKAQPGLLPTFRTVELDREAMAYAVGATLFTALLLALFPVWRLSRASVRDALQAAGRSNSDARNPAGASLMISAEIAMACVLLAGAGMMIQALRNLSRIDVGYDPNGLISIAFAPPAGKTYTDESAKALLDRVEEAARSVPGYQSAALSGNFGIGGNGMLGPVVIPGRTNPSTPPLVPVMVVSPDFFETMRIPFKAGRTFAAFESKITESKIPEAIVNEEFIRRFLPDENPIGRKVSIWDPAVIIGVVGNSRLQGTLPEVKPEVYMTGINAGWGPTLLVRAQGNLGVAARVLHDRVKEVEPGMRVGTPLTLVSREEGRTVIERFMRGLLLAFAILATILACLGIYGVASYSVAQRTREIGIRMALGATQANVTRLVVGRTILATALGGAAGIAGAAALSRFIKSLLYEASVWNPAVMAGVVGALVITALLATMAPAIRATQVDPAISLRQD
jgi:predicted permease